MTLSDLRLLVRNTALRHDLPEAVLLAQVEVESSFQPYAWNPEPRYKYFWNVKTGKPFRVVTPSETASKTPPPDFPTLAGDSDQEWWAQQASWGLLQVMGAVAREQGFREPWLTKLLEPEIGLELGALVLKDNLKRSHGSLEVALAAYNGGPVGNTYGQPLRNQSYVDKVLVVLQRNYAGQSWGSLPVRT